MDYIELSCKIDSQATDLVRELLIQELADRGFESFVDTKNGLMAYIANKDFNPKRLSEISFEEELELGKIAYQWKLVKDQNWNIEWEKNFNPVLINNQCYIRATFHQPKPDIKYEIVIDPKMSFGTGHHETTSLMVERMLSMNFKDKNVLDMGCGTAILAILSSMLGAKSADAIDIDEWAYQNSIENCRLNGMSNINIFCGNRNAVPKRSYDIILANINRNILLNDMDIYADHLVPNGILLLSGIYSTDLPLIQDAADKNLLFFIENSEKNNWTAAAFRKK